MCAGLSFATRMPPVASGTMNCRLTTPAFSTSGAAANQKGESERKVGRLRMTSSRVGRKLSS